MKLFARKPKAAGNAPAKEEKARPPLPAAPEPLKPAARAKRGRHWPRVIGGALALWLTAGALGQVTIVPPPTTVYTRSLLRSVDAGTARTNLGILSTNGIVTGLMPDNTTAINNGDGSFTVVFPSQTNGFGNIVYSNASAFTTRAQSTNDAAYQALLATNGLVLRGLTALSNIVLVTNGGVVAIGSTGGGGGSFDTTVSNAYNGTFTGNAAGLTNIVPGIEILLHPPHKLSATNFGDYQVTGNNSHFAKPAGSGISGIIREIWFQLDVGSSFSLNTNIQNLWLEVFVDNGDTTNLAARVINVPLADLMGNRYRFTTNGHWAIDRDALWLFSQDRSALDVLSGDYIKTMQWRLPVYFTNGCLIRITNALAGELWTHGYINATYETNVDLSLLGPYADYRLRSAHTRGAQASGASNFLFQARGPGFCAAFFQGFLDPTGGGFFTAFLDSKGPTFLTAPGRVWKTAGGDDFYLQTYMMASGVILGAKAGVMNRWFGPAGDSTSAAVEAYRFFDTDAIYWTQNPCPVYIPNSGSLPEMSATMFYYAP